VVYHGEVQGLDAGTGSVFGLLPPDNATGNYIHIVEAGAGTDWIAGRRTKG
jgi:membrane fusion protein (multidrug efflux system)